jgi:crotonobetainyl-CoA:carnitine CoA-transferase CaiB-like acyl-CoA transferase
VRARLKLRAREVCAVNPRLIYASLTPYGETGPEAGNTAYDATAWWARSGLLDSIRATSDSPPAMPVPAMGDHMAANMLYGAILTALYRRERTGKGGAVGSSLMGNGIWSNGLYVQAALDGAQTKRHMGRERLGALTQMYQCRDDRWFMLTLLPQAQDKLWPQLARCMGHQEWIEDPKFSDSAARRENKAALTALLSSVFKERDWQDWRVDFEKYGITSGCIAKSVDHGMDEQARVTGMITEFDDGSGARTIDSPLYVDGEQKRSPHPAPRLGEHSLAILAELGIGAQTITKLCDEGIVGRHSS